MKTIRIIFLLCVAVISGTLSAQSQRELGELMRNRGEYYFTLSVNDRSEIQAISDLCSVDGTDGRTVVCYANQKEYDKLLQLGYEPNLQTPPSLREEAKMWDGNRATYDWDSYPTYSQFESMMQAFPSSTVNDRSCSYMELGTLNSGRKIMGVRINNGDTTRKPKFLYSSTIHGDETTGMILMLRLIDELCTSTDSRIVNLVNNLDIFIFPDANPDGTYYGGNNTVTGSRRANANGVDMNRNYPDPHSSAHPDGNAYQTETQWFMQLAEDYPFVMAANFHGGAEVMNYPWDNTKTRHADDAWWQYVSNQYVAATRAVYSSYMTDTYSSGITNGADWYMIGGGRQDYMNGYRQCREITIECSSVKTLPAAQLNTYWNYNHSAILGYMEQCLYGVHGVVKDAITDLPIDGVTVTVLNHDDEYSIVSSHEDGDFHRPIKGGTYTFEFSKEGYCSESMTVTATDGQRNDYQVYLYPEGSCPPVCYEQVIPASAGSYLMGYRNGSSIVMPTHNNSSTLTSTSVNVNPTDNGFFVDRESVPTPYTLTSYGNNGQYYISYNGRYLTRSNNGSITWSNSNNSSSSRWYINENGIYVAVSSGGWGGSITNYYLYYNNGFRLNTTNSNNITFYQEGDCVFTKDIIKYSANTKDRYYLIASPIGEVGPADVDNMLANDYDLYYFDQNGTDQVDDETVLNEWRNYECNNFNLTAGKGYLYANSQDVTLTFSGSAYYGSGEVTLSKTGNVRFSGWNLVGNPFAQTAYITKPFYTMNGDGTEIIPGTGNSVGAMEGIFVIAENDGETMTFSKSMPAKAEGQIVLNVNQGEATLDRAIVCMGEGSMLPKFMLNENSTKVYITQEGQEYAVVRVADAGIIPVSFKATHDGTYSISVNVDDTDVKYLHLIDNMTGADIDVLQTPNYSFEATKDDYTSRFKLVFATGTSEEESFAFFTNDNWIISNDGEAVLQVIDVNGRVLSSEEIHGSQSKYINAAPGIYLLRLINGDNVKVQKIVIR